MRFEEFHPQLEQMVTTIANEYGAKGRRYGADSDDFRQEFAVWLLTNEEFVGRLLEMNHAEGVAYVDRTLRSEGRAYLRSLGAQVGERDPWHGRHAVSNAAARAHQSQSYNDGGPE